MARFTWKLLFQSGLLNNQELHLPDGEVTVGSGSEWDIDMLGAMSSSKEGHGTHIEFSVQEESVLLRPLGMHCVVDGQGVDSEEVALQAGQTVDIEGCVFMLRRVGEESVASDMPELEGLDAEMSPTSIDSKSTTHQFGFETHADDLFDEDHKTGIEEQPSAAHSKRAAGPGRWFRVFRVALPGSLAAGIIFALAYAGQELRASVIMTSEPFSLERYQESLSKAGLAVQIERDKTGTVKLVGSCWKTDALQPFLNRLTESGTAYRNEVLCQDDLQHSAKYILQANGYPNVRVTSGPRLGSLVIAGNITADAKWQKVTQQLNKLQGLLDWSVYNDTETSLSDLILTLRQHGLLSYLSLLRQDDVLTVTGQLNEAQQHTLKKILQAYEVPEPRMGMGESDHVDKPSNLTQAPQASIKQRAPLRIVYQNIPALKQEENVFPAAIVSFSGNQQTAALQLANGMTVQVGSTLPSGYIITQLDETGVEVQKKGQLIRFPWGFEVASQ